MTTWLLRGLVFAAGMVVVRLAQGTLINQAAASSLLISVILLALYWVGAFVWGLLDGRADANDSPDPDRRRDLAMRWLLAGMVAGAVSGLVTWLISLFNNDIYVSGLIAELTAVAAFTALAVFIPAIIAVSLGRFLVDRANPYQGRRRVTDGDGTDVFDAVSEDYEAPSDRVAVAERREETWRQEARDAVEEVHEAARQRQYGHGRDE
ncbi:MAG: B-4DMT family transporter [Mycobacterium sp.]